MTTPRRAAMVRLYEVAMALLPPSVRRMDGAEMVDAFGALWAEPMSAAARVRLACRVFGRLPLVAVMEWTDLMGWTGSTKGEGMMGWGSNLRYSLRTLRKAPAFAITTIGLIGLGVGAVTTIFTLVDHVLLRPLPYPAADRLVTVEMGSHSGVSFRGFQTLNGVEQWVAAYTETANLTGEGDPTRVEVGTVTEGFFPFFGARPVAGRLLVDEDFAAANTIVVVHGTWERLFGSDPDLVGRSIRIDGNAYEVVGVLDDSFEPPQNMLEASVDFLRPIPWDEETFANAGYHVLEVAGRLGPGVSHADVQGQLDALSARLAEAYPDNMMDREGNPHPMPLVDLQASTVDRVRAGLGLLLGAVGLLLLVACLNVAHLFLARGIGRVQEMAVRRALGAGAAGLLRQLMTESLLIGLVGCALGIGLAWVGIDVFLAANPTALPRADAVRLDLRVAGFAMLVSLVTALLFGLVPALRTVGSDLAGELKGTSRGSTGGRGAQRARGGLVMAEVALSLILVAQAGLLLKSFMQVQALDPGFEAGNVWTVPLTPTGIETPEAYVQEMDEVLASLERLPGVSAAAYGLTLPFEFTGGGRCCWSNRGTEVDGVVHEDVRLMLQPVTPDYFETLRLPLLSGGVWSRGDARQDPTPAVLSERLAIELFGSAEAATGRRMGRSGSRQYLVVGVAADNRHYGLDQDLPTSIYVPVEIVPFTIPLAHFAVRIEGEAPDGFARTLREAVWVVTPDMPIPTVQRMEDWIVGSTSGRRFDSAVFGAFGLAGLLLAAAGLYGTLLYNVRQQRRELGIRMALGAGRAQVEREVVGRGVRLALAGSVIGMLGAVWVGRRLEERLFEVEAADPVALGGAALVLLAAAALASWLPARRAGRTDPLQTLKVD